VAFDRVSHFSNAGGMSFNSYCASLNHAPGAGSVPASSSPAAAAVDDASLDRLAKIGQAEVRALCAPPVNNAGERLLLMRSYIRGGSLLSMSASDVHRINAVVAERLRKLQPWLHRALDDLRVDLVKWDVEEIQILGHVKGSSQVAHRVADMAKQYLVERGSPADAVTAVIGAQDVSTLGFTVRVFGTVKPAPQCRGDGTTDKCTDAV